MKGYVILPYDKKRYEKIEEYYIVKPYAKAIIARDKVSQAIKYFLIEEPLTEEERQQIVEIIEKKIKYKLVASKQLVTKDLIYKEIENLDRKLRYYIERDYLGYGPIHALILDPNLEDISCNGVNIPIYVWHRKYESLETNIIIVNTDYLRSYIRSLAARCGKHISSAFPILDATLPDTGYRLAATLDVISTKGSTFTIRKFRERPFTITELILDGVIDPLIAAFFWFMIENKRTFMIFGATGSGKTTLLNALLTFVHPAMKICTVEETREINIPSKNWVPFVSRETYAVGERIGEVSLYDLVKVTLRYRPDYIIVGEVRGAEAYVLFQAMQSGHGGISTMHAESIESMINRLTNPPMNVPPQLIPTLNFVIHISRVKINKRIARRVLAVYEVHSVDSYVKLAEWDPINDTFIHYLDKSEILERVAEQIGLTKEKAWQEIERRAALLEYLAEKKIVEYNEIVKWVYSYYSEPEEVIKKIARERPLRIPRILPSRPAFPQVKKIEIKIPKIENLTRQNITLSKNPINSSVKENKDRSSIDKINADEIRKLFLSKFSSKLKR